MNGKATNPNDPLWLDAPARVAFLTKTFAEAAHQFSAQDVINAGASVMITAMRQVYATRQEAEARFDEVFGRTKTHLLNHYDSISGRKSGAFPYDQKISAGLIVSANNFPSI